MLVNKNEKLCFFLQTFKNNLTFVAHWSALDAYCLIEIHDVIEREFNRIEIDFNEFINTFLTEKKSRIVLKKAMSTTNSQKKSTSTVQPSVVGPNPNCIG